MSRYLASLTASKGAGRHDAMRIQIVAGKSLLETTLHQLFEALRSVADSEAEAEAVFEEMVDEGRVRVVWELPRAA